MTAVLPANVVHANRYTEMGSGVFGCGEILESRDEKRRTPGRGLVGIQRSIDYSWLQGYVAGANDWGNGGKGLVRGKSISWLSGWAYDYCQKNKGRSWADAAKAMVDALKN